MNTSDSMIYPQDNLQLWGQMNPLSNSSLPVVLDPVAAVIIAQLQQKLEEQDARLARSKQALAAADSVIQQLKDALRLERIQKYGKRSETLSDLQLQLLDLEPAVSSDEIDAESRRDPISEAPQEEQSASSTAQQQQKKRKPHPGRNELLAHLKRVEEVIACTPEQCACGRCGGETSVIGYEQTEVLGKKPVEYYVRVIKREKRACAACVLQ